MYLHENQQHADSMTGLLSLRQVSLTMTRAQGYPNTSHEHVDKFEIIFDSFKGPQVKNRCTCGLPPPYLSCFAAG